MKWKAKKETVEHMEIRSSQNSVKSVRLMADGCGSGTGLGVYGGKLPP